MIKTILVPLDGYGVDRLLHGSVGRSLIHDVRLPLLLLPAPCVNEAQAHTQHPEPAIR